MANARQVAQAYPEDALAYALLGSAHYNTGQSAEATKQLRKCLELSPGQGEAYAILARIAYEKGDLEESERLGREALKRGPPNPEVLNQLGRALMDQGRTQEAVEALQQATRLPRPSSESFYLLGQAQLQAGTPAQGKQSFLQAVALLPDHTQAFFGLFRACAALGQADEAAKYREQFLKLEATDRRSLTDRSAQEDTLSGLPLVRQTVARTIFGAAQIHQVHKQTDEAARLFRRAASLDADAPVYRAALEAFYVQRRGLAEGTTVFEALAAEQPDNGLNYYYLGRLYTRMERFDAAEQAYRKLQKLAPQWPEGYRALAELYLRANRKLNEALVLARQAVELEPNGEHYYLLAVACLKNSDRAGAVEAMQEAVKRSPDEKPYRDLLQQLSRQP